MSHVPPDASAQRVQQVIAAANVGLFDWDLRSNTVRDPPEWKRQLGCADADVSNAFWEWERRVHPDDSASSVATLRAYVASPWPDFRLETRMRHSDGDYRWILALAAIECNDEGTPVRVLGSHIDITERKHAELAVRDLLRFDQDVLDSLSAHICVVDVEGVILAVNKAGPASREGTRERVGYRRRRQLPGGV